MAEVEQNWFRRVLAGDANAPYIYGGLEDGELVPLDDANWEDDLAIWHAECEASRQAVATRSLDDTGLRNAQPCSLRWIYVHMIEEYARHNGHADLIREMVDGRVGW
jgi:hypothetical protein